MVPSSFGIFNKKIHADPPFHIRFLYQKNIFLFAKLTIKIKNKKSNTSLPNRNQTHLQQQRENQTDLQKKIKIYDNLKNS